MAWGPVFADERALLKVVEDLSIKVLFKVLLEKITFFLIFIIYLFFYKK